MQTRQELDEMEAREVDIAARLFLLRGTDEGSPTYEYSEENLIALAAEDEAYGFLPMDKVDWELEEQRKLVRRSMEACRLKNRKIQAGGCNVIQRLPRSIRRNGDR